MSGSVHNLSLDGGKLIIDSANPTSFSPLRKGSPHRRARTLSEHTPAKESTRHQEVQPTKDDLQEILLPTPLELHKITVLKDSEIDDYGFSVSDGLLEKGVYVNMIRPDGPADQSGLKPYDRVLQVNHVRTRDFDCCLAVPLLSEAGDKLDLVISRNPLAHASNPLLGDELPVKHSTCMEPKTSTKTL